jgi:hypothetical protein
MTVTASPFSAEHDVAAIKRRIRIRRDGQSMAFRGRDILSPAIRKLSSFLGRLTHRLRIANERKITKIDQIFILSCLAMRFCGIQNGVDGR